MVRYELQEPSRREKALVFAKLEWCVWVLGNILLLLVKQASLVWQKQVQSTMRIDCLKQMNRRSKEAKKRCGWAARFPVWSKAN